MKRPLIRADGQPDRRQSVGAERMRKLNADPAFAKANGAHELIKSFDPDAEEILIVQPLVGG